MRDIGSSTVPYEIRVLGADDVAHARALNALFAAVFEDAETYAGAPPSPDYLHALLGSGSFVAVVALDGDEVIGGLTAYELRKLERERSEMYLYDLAVSEPHRRQGVATALIDELRRVAAERGAWVVFVQADDGDEPAIALYSKLGLREEVLHFDIEPAR